MATKQTEEIGHYNGSLSYIEDKNTIAQAGLLAWHEWENKRISISKFVDFLQSTLSFPKDYVEIASDGTRSISLDTIKSASHYTRGINFPDGISLGDNDIYTSWIGFHQLTPSSYGFDSTTAIPANVCYGTFGMETVYINDLYVKNLHTANSYSSDSQDNAVITNLTTDTITPKDSCGLVHINGGISFDSDVFGIFKLDRDTSHYSFDNGLFVGGDCSINFSDGAKIFYGEGDCIVSNRGIWIQPIRGEQAGYLYAGDCDNTNVFNSGGGLTKVYSQTEIDTKLQPLTTINTYFKGSLGDFNSTSDFRSALNNMIKDKKEAGRYVATLYGSLIIVTFALLDKSSGTYSQWVEGSIVKGSDGELYLNNELGYRICGRVGLGTTWGVWRANVLDDELPIAATKSHDGLMSKEDKTAFESMKTTIESLEARIAALEAK